MNLREFFLEACLSRQMYQWLKKTWKLPLEDYRTFERKILAGDESAFHPLSSIIQEKLKLRSQHVYKIFTQQTYCLILASVCYHIDLNDCLTKNLSYQGDRADCDRKNFEFTLQIATGMVRRYLGHSPDSNLKIVFSYLRHLNKTFDQSGARPLNNLISYLRSHQGAESLTKLHSFFEKQGANLSKRTVQKLEKQERFHFSTLWEIAKGAATTLENQMILVLLLVVAHAIQYYLIKAEKKPSEVTLPWFLESLFQLEHFWKMDHEKAGAWAEHLFQSSPIKPEWKIQAIEYIKRIYYFENPDLLDWRIPGQSKPSTLSVFVIYSLFSFFGELLKPKK